jgi:phosphoadenylyl-sulfate reductase (thioredoxin)
MPLAPHLDLESMSAQDLLAWAAATYGSRFGVLTSFQDGGMVLVDMAAKLGNVRVFTLDTGRLPMETHQMIEQVRSMYGLKVEIVSPDAQEVERMTSQYGPNLFYRDVAYRRLCCEVRKVRPLERKLREFEAYAVGLRRSQSESRSEVSRVDRSAPVLKLSPIADWSPEQIQAYLKQNNVPRHPLYALGYTSIGCGPCTRPTSDGEDERAGRWWWELDAEKECGLHFSNGKAERRLDVLLRDVVQLSGHA